MSENNSNGAIPNEKSEKTSKGADLRNCNIPLEMKLPVAASKCSTDNKNKTLPATEATPKSDILICSIVKYNLPQEKPQPIVITVENVLKYNKMYSNDKKDKKIPDSISAATKKSEELVLGFYNETPKMTSEKNDKPHIRHKPESDIPISVKQNIFTSTPKHQYKTRFALRVRNSMDSPPKVDEKKNVKEDIGILENHSDHDGTEVGLCEKFRIAQCFHDYALPCSGEQ